jgi:hypothetical protein
MQADLLEAYIKDILQPWKLLVFVFGMLFLLYGAHSLSYVDWDYGICFAMGIPTYLTAGWVMRVILDRKLQLLPVALVLLWVSADLSYVIYWGLKSPATLEALRWASFAASVPMYMALGLVLIPVGSLRQVLQNIRQRTK